MGVAAVRRRPAFLDLRRLQGRIVALFLGLLLVIQVANFGFVRYALDRQAERTLDGELDVGRGILTILLQQRAARKSAAVELLAQDYGFRSALGQGLTRDEDLATLRDALDNHGKRIGADLAAYFDVGGRMLAAEGAAIGLQVLKFASDEGNDLQLTVIEGQLYQLVQVPVRAPLVIGHVVMGFKLDRDLLEQLLTLTNVGSLIQLRGSGSVAPPLVVEDAQLAFLQQTDGSVVDRDALNLLDADEGRLRARWVTLLPANASAGTPEVRALLWVPYRLTLRSFKDLQLALIGLNVLGILAFAVGAVLTARRVSRPIQALARSAERLGEGDYEGPVTASSDLSEVQELAQSLEHMRLGIRDREREVQRLAFWDPLTGLPNRVQFLQRLQPLQPTGLLMLNLDRFKHVNDVLGRDVGDQLLQQVTQRLQGCVGGEALLARVGGDEFAIAVPGGEEAPAMDLARRVLEAFEDPMCLGAQTVDVGAAIGIALALRHAREPEGLVSRAEQAMHAAKRTQAGVKVYDDSLDDRSRASLGLLSELRQAVEHHELRLYLQPKLNLRSQRVEGAEALVRWQHPVRGLVPPGLFIPFAEQTGFIRELSRWMLIESLRFAVQARAQGEVLRISVNLSTRDLLDADLPGKIQAWLAAEGGDPSLLCLEITESAIMDDPARALATAKDLAQQGFKLSIDDFGTGYSSLAYLKQLPVRELKIDQSFVFGMEADEGDREIVRSTINLAHNLKKSVVAEGIETQGALDLLAAMGCDEAQGYFIAKPMPADQFLAWARARAQG
jgi:diguanylate cyclase (GGDEF)-like protein